MSVKAAMKRHKKIILTMCKKYGKTLHEYDVQQECVIALWKALDKYDSNTGDESGWVYFTLKGHMNNLVQKKTRKRRTKPGGFASQYCDAFDRTNPLDTLILEEKVRKHGKNLLKAIDCNKGLRYYIKKKWLEDK